MNRAGRLGVLVLLACLGACEKGELRVDKVEPSAGINGGGDHVSIYGSGFVPGTTQVEVRFGRRRADQVVIASNRKISVVTPAGDKGPVDVTLTFNNGAHFKIENGFRYVSPQASQDVRKAFFSDKAGEKK